MASSVAWRTDRHAWFTYYYDADGRRHSKKLPGFKHNEKRRARREAERIAAEHDAVHVSEIDIETAAATYLDSKKPETSLRTWERYRSVLGSFVKQVCPGGQRVRLTAVGVTQVERWRNERLETRHPNTVRNDLKALRAFWNWMIEREWCTRNPARKVKYPPRKFEQMLIPGYPTVNKIIAAAKPLGTEFYALALLGGRAGMRRGDILRLEWTNVDLGSRVIYVFNGKSSVPRAIPMDDEIAEFFGALPRTVSPAVFPSKYKASTIKRSPIIAKDFNAWAKKHYGITHKALRHAFSDQLRRLGVDEAVRRLILGHEDPVTTRIYTHAHVDEARPLVVRLASIGSNPESPAQSSTTPVPSADRAESWEKSA